MHNNNGCQDVRRKGSIVHSQPSYPSFQDYLPPQLSGWSLNTHGHHATVDWNSSSVSICHESLIVMKAISTPPSIHSYHSYFILSTNSILRPKHLYLHQSILIQTTPQPFYSHTQQQHYDTTLYSFLHWLTHQPIVRRPHIHCPNCIYTTKTTCML